MRGIFTFKEIWTQDKIITYFGRHSAWLKYFTYHLVDLQILAPNYKQHILPPAEV
jgi:hypothetical protein